MARREERAYREYVSDEQRSQPGCPARELCDESLLRDTRVYGNNRANRGAVHAWKIAAPAKNPARYAIELLTPCAARTCCRNGHPFASVERKPTPQPPATVSVTVSASEAPNGPGRPPATSPITGNATQAV